MNISSHLWVPEVVYSYLVPVLVWLREEYWLLVGELDKGDGEGYRLQIAEFVYIGLLSAMPFALGTG